MRTIALAIFLFATISAYAEEGGLEYRIEKKIGYPLDWSDGKTVFFHELPFMTSKDFAKASAVPAKNPNTPGRYDVEISHSVTGRAKFAAVADADRERTYCVIFRNIVRACASFAPPVKAIYNGSIVFDLPKAEADKLAADINASLKGR